MERNWNCVCEVFGSRNRDAGRNDAAALTTQAVWRASNFSDAMARPILGPSYETSQHRVDATGRLRALLLSDLRYDNGKQKGSSFFHPTVIRGNAVARIAWYLTSSTVAYPTPLCRLPSRRRPAPAAAAAAAAAGRLASA